MATDVLPTDPALGLRPTVEHAINQVIWFVPWQTVDFFGNLPIEVRRGIFSGKFMIFHTSSHLGDDYIRRTDNLGFRYSNEGLKALLSAEPCEEIRVYTGATQLIHAIPGPDRVSVQEGVELTSPELGFWKDYPAHAYIAEDLKSKQAVRWNTDSRTVAGIKIGFKGTTRAMRMYVGYFTGHSPYGQFFLQREHYADIGIALDL